MDIIKNIKCEEEIKCIIRDIVDSQVGLPDGREICFFTNIYLFESFVDDIMRRFNATNKFRHICYSMINEMKDATLINGRYKMSIFWINTDEFKEAICKNKSIVQYGRAHVPGLNQEMVDVDKMSQLTLPNLEFMIKNMLLTLNKFYRDKDWLYYIEDSESLLEGTEEF